MEENIIPLQINTSTANYVQEITLDLNSNNAYTVVSAKQADTGRYLKIFLTKDNVAYDIDPSHTCYIRVRKPDGYAVVDNASIQGEAGKHYILVQLTNQMLAVGGRAYADVVEQDGSNVLSSISFILNIMSSPAVGEITSSNEFDALSALISRADVLLQHAPKIGLDSADASTYKYWLRWTGTDSAGYFENTGVYAEGKDGRDGVSPIIGTVGADKDKWMIWDATESTYISTDVIALGSSAIISGASATITNTVGTPSAWVETDGTDFNRSFVFHFDNLKGEKGDVGAPGAGGLSWVDGKEGTTERAYASISVCITPNAINDFIFDNNTKTLTWAADESLLYSNITKYLKIGLSDTNTGTGPDSYYEVQNWVVPVGGSDQVTGLNFRSSVTTFPTSTNPSYIWGYYTEEAGNVRLQAVTYNEQSTFKWHNDSGEEQVIEIDSAMKRQARLNIDAMQYIAPESGKLIGCVSSDAGWIAADSTEILHELNYNDLLMITQNYAYASAATPTAVESESNSENEGE